MCSVIVIKCIDPLPLLLSLIVNNKGLHVAQRDCVCYIIVCKLFVSMCVCLSLAIV